MFSVDVCEDKENRGAGQRLPDENSVGTALKNSVGTALIHADKHCPRCFFSILHRYRLVSTGFFK